jgi:hypothetical protein
MNNQFHFSSVAPDVQTFVRNNMLGAINNVNKFLSSYMTSFNMVENILTDSTKTYNTHEELQDTINSHSRILQDIRSSISNGVVNLGAINTPLLFRDIPAEFQRKLWYSAREAMARLALQAKVSEQNKTSHVRLANRHRQIETLFPAVPANAQTGLMQESWRVRSTEAAKDIFNRMLQGLTYAAADIFPNIDIAKIAQLINIAPTRFAVSMNARGLSYNIGTSNIYVALPSNYGYSQVFLTFHHEMWHATNFILTDLARMGSARARDMLQQLADALELPRHPLYTDVADLAFWDRGEQYYKQPAEQITFGSINVFLKWFSDPSSQVASLARLMLVYSCKSTCSYNYT